MKTKDYYRKWAYEQTGRKTGSDTYTMFFKD